MDHQDGEDEITVLETAENKLKDLGVDFSPASPAACLPALCARILAARAALGGLGEVPPLAPAAGLPEALQFAASLGLPYTLGAGEEERTAAVVDFLASELQALRFALAAQRREARAAEALARSASLETELHSLLRALSIPALRGDAASTHPEKVLAQVRAWGGTGARWLPAPAHLAPSPPPPPPYPAPPPLPHTRLPLLSPPHRSGPRWTPWCSACPRGFLTSARC